MPSLIYKGFLVFKMPGVRGGCLIDLPHTRSPQKRVNTAKILQNPFQNEIASQFNKFYKNQLKDNKLVKKTYLKLFVFVFLFNFILSFC